MGPSPIELLCFACQVISVLAGWNSGELRLGNIPALGSERFYREGLVWLRCSLPSRGGTNEELMGLEGEGV